MAYAAIASGTETITVKTASSSRAAITPQTHAHSHRKASKSICFKNTFLTLLIGRFWRYMMHLQLQRRKNRWRPVNSFVQLDDSVVLSLSLPLGGKNRGLEGTSPAQRSADRLPCCTPQQALGSEGINQDNSLQALTFDPTTIHTNISRAGRDEETKQWGETDTKGGKRGASEVVHVRVYACLCVRECVCARAGHD